MVEDSRGGSGANEGRNVGVTVGGCGADAKECRNSIDACFFDNTGLDLGSDVSSIAWATYAPDQAIATADS